MNEPHGAIFGIAEYPLVTQGKQRSHRLAFTGGLQIHLCQNNATQLGHRDKKG
jgi:hypothetical protein